MMNIRAYSVPGIQGVDAVADMRVLSPPDRASGSNVCSCRAGKLASFHFDGQTCLKLNNISATTGTKELDVAWEPEPGVGSSRRQHNAEPEPPPVEDERFLDHHIEEMLGTLSHAARTRESGLDADGQPLD
jgi:hypothetical protein